MPVIRAAGLKKTYTSKITGVPIRALDGAGLTVEPGEIFGILGPNGAGKTTLLNCLSLLLQPDEGTVELFGQDAIKFHGKNGCISKDAKRAIATLKKVGGMAAAVRRQRLHR